MNDCIVESIAINIAPARAFAYIADLANMPEWTNAFRSVENGRAVLETPRGKVKIDLAVLSSSEHGVIDWKITFPDGGETWARSRVSPLGAERCAYSFVLPMPSAELEKLEGKLEEQGRLLRHELHKLQGILEQ